MFLESINQTCFSGFTIFKSAFENTYPNSQKSNPSLFCQTAMKTYICALIKNKVKK